MKNVNVEKFTDSQINESKLKAEDWAKKKRTDLLKLRNNFSAEEYKQKRNLIQKKLDERIVLLNDVLARRDNKKEMPQLASLIMAVLTLFVLWMQPWESPVEKISDEWKNCNNKYDGQCSYVGKKFKTNSFEMFISETIHGEYGDNECSRSIYWEQC